MYELNVIVDNIRDWVVFPFFTGLAVIIFIYAGILFAISNGDPSKVTTARKAVIIGVIGVFIGVAAIILTNFVAYILGVPGNAK